MASCGWFPLPHDEIVAWVEEHRDALPATLAELSTYPVAFRRVIAQAVSPEQRLRWWQAHLETFLDPGAGLTADQRAFVAEAIPHLRDIFGNPLLEAQTKVSALHERMAQVLSQRQCAEVFGMLGPSEPPEGLPLPPGTRLTPIRPAF